MKNLFNILYSTRLMAVLFFLFATAMGIATFIENDYGTQTSKALVYNTWWFEAIIALFIINFFGNIFRYKLYKKEKWAVLLFHISFLFILIGAGITRYISFEGMMIINEGETTNKFLSETTYLNLIVDNNEFQKETNFPLLLSAWGKNTKEFTTTFQPKKNKKAQKINVELIEYTPWAEKKLITDKNGEEHLFLVESSQGTRHEHWIKKGTVQNIHNILIGFEAPNNNASINFFYKNGNLKIRSKNNGNWLRMADQEQGNIVKDSVQNFQYLTLHTIAGLQFVIPKPAEKGMVKTVRGTKDNKKFDAVAFNITTNNKTKQIELMGGQFNTDGVKSFSVGGLNFRAWYGAKQLKTPFKIKLNDFQLEKYPGSESAASYASEITVIDKKETFDYRIFMNHILDYKGYKFFQSSYKNAGQPIEQTHLSVNHDFWGMLFTYIGYSLLYIGLISMLFAKHTRFNSLKKQLKKINAKKNTLFLFCSFSFFGYMTAQEHNHIQTKTTHSKTHQKNHLSEQKIDSILNANIVSKEHANRFSKLVIQDKGGRMKPAHTFASELMRKVTHTNNFKGMSPSQFLLSITENPRFWLEVPMVYLGDKNNKQIRQLLHVPDTTKYARLADFFDANANYKIKQAVANAQKSKRQNYFDKDLIKVDQRVGLLYQAIGGSILRIYPIPNHEENKWVSPPETLMANFKGTDSVFVRQSLPVYLQLLQKGKKTGNFKDANNVLEGLKKFQKKYGINVIPSENKINAEIAYNNINIFGKLVGYYLLTGLLIILLYIFQLFYHSKFLKYAIQAIIGFAIILFIFHTTGLIARWYISGHAPWANAYESIIYVAWATVLFGLFLGRKSTLTIGATIFLAGIILFFASQNWIDPEIANLVPVLNSWWVLVHVSIIVGSYGPLSLGMILGIVVLFLMIFTNKKNKKKMETNIKELTIINEMSLVVGLVMLTVGNFLGGMWANESWGRYWGWDPKETWALISIMIYAFVLHMRLIPGLRSIFTFNLWSIISYASIMMTYFGVNFYLSGLHSYASGDKVITPTSVYYSILFVVVLGFWAYIKFKRHYKKH